MIDVRSLVQRRALLLHAATGFLIALLPAFQYRSGHERRSRRNHGDL